MSYESVAACVGDYKMCNRINACVVKEAAQNPNFSGTSFADAVLLAPPGPAYQLYWPVAINAEADYESGYITDPETAANNVSDGEILSAVQASWPGEPRAEPTP